MVSLMPSGWVSFQSLHEGIWQPSATPRFGCLHEGTCPFKEQTPTEEGWFVQNCPNPPSGRIYLFPLSLLLFLLP